MVGGEIMNEINHVHRKEHVPNWICFLLFLPFLIMITLVTKTFLFMLHPIDL